MGQWDCVFSKEFVVSNEFTGSRFQSVGWLWGRSLIASVAYPWNLVAAYFGRKSSPERLGVYVTPIRRAFRSHRPQVCLER